MTDKQSPTSSATVAAQVDLKPQGSQNFLVGMIALAAGAMVAGSLMLGAHNDAGWAFIALILVFVGIATKGWFVAHADADLNDAKPTTFSTGGLTVSTDSRTLRNSDAMYGLQRLLETGLRQKLPAASGIVENGAAVPDSAAAAAEREKQINAVVDEQARSVEELLNRRSSGPVVTQRSAEALMPPAEVKPQTNVSTES